MAVSRVILTLLFTTPFLIAAEGQLLPGSEAIPTNWGNLTAMGALIVGLLFLVVYYVPQSQQRLVDLSNALTTINAKMISEVTDKDAKSREATRLSFLATLDKLAEREEARMNLYHEDHDKMAEALKTLSVQCAQARGIKLQT